MFNQAKQISTFFTFNGNGEEAFNFYLNTFPDAKKSASLTSRNQSKVAISAKY